MIASISKNMSNFGFGKNLTVTDEVIENISRYCTNPLKSAKEIYAAEAHLTNQHRTDSLLLDVDQKDARNAVLTYIDQNGNQTKKTMTKPVAHWTKSAIIEFFDEVSGI